jgi:ankyrin repeat protein
MNKNLIIKYIILLSIICITSVFSKEKEDLQFFKYCDKDEVKKLESFNLNSENLKFKNPKGLTLLAYCIEKKAEKSSSYLLNFENDYNWSDINGYNLAILSIRSNFKDLLLKILLKNPTLIDKKDRFNNSLLDHSILKKRKEIVKYFYEKQPSFFDRNKINIATLQKAIESDSLEIIEKILPSKPNNLRESEESFLLQRCAQFSPNNLSYLVSLGFNINSKDEKSNTIFHKLAILNNSESIEYLKNFSIQMNKNFEGQYPFHLAARFGKTKVLKKFLEWNSILNEIDNSGNTILHLAAEFGDSEMVYNIILSKPNLSLKNNKGETPLYISRVSGNEGVYYLLLLAGAVE